MSQSVNQTIIQSVITVVRYTGKNSVYVGRYVKTATTTTTTTTTTTATTQLQQ